MKTGQELRARRPLQLASAGTELARGRPRPAAPPATPGRARPQTAARIPAMVLVRLGERCRELFRAAVPDGSQGSSAKQKDAPQIASIRQYPPIPVCRSECLVPPDSGATKLINYLPGLLAERKAVPERSSVPLRMLPLEMIRDSGSHRPRCFKRLRPCCAVPLHDREDVIRDRAGGLELTAISHGIRRVT
jgi:hypothetical protein